MGRKIIKWTGLILALVVLVSSYFYVLEKKNEPLVSSDDLLKLGIIETREKKNYPKAISLLKQGLRSAPKYADIRSALGRAYLLNGQADSAKLYLLSALRYDKKNETALLNLAGISLTAKDTLATLQYLNRYIKYYPRDENSWRKKYLLQLQLRQYPDAEITARAFGKRFRSDTLRSITGQYWQTLAEAQQKEGNRFTAYKNYRIALNYKPNDTAVLEQLVILSLHYNDYYAAAGYNKALLKVDRNNTVYSTHAYARAHGVPAPEIAAATAEKTYRLNPLNETAKKDMTRRYLSLAKKAKGEIKVRYAAKLLNVIPDDRDALMHAINGHLEMQRYTASLEAVEKALAQYPTDQSFIDKKVGILADTKNYTGAISYLDTILITAPLIHYIQVYEDLILAMSVSLIQQGRLSEAQTAIQKGLVYAADNKALLEQLLNIYALQGNNREAIVTADRLIGLTPSVPGYRFKKAGLLELQNRFEDAAEIHLALHQQYPANITYYNAYTDAITAAQKQQAQALQWHKVIGLYNKAVQFGNPGHLVFQYAIAAYTQLADHEQALQLTDTALARYPNDSFFLAKKTQAYYTLNRYAEGLNLGKTLIARFPSDTGLQRMYLDQLQTAGKYYERVHQNDSALNIFFTAYHFLPNDTFALQNISAIYFVKKQYDSSIYYANLGLQVDSNNTYLLMKKASAHEQLKEYRAAYAAASRALALKPSEVVADYTAYLKSKTYRNQVGITHLRSFFSSEGQFASVTGVHYMRRFNKGSIAAKLALGDRPVGAGVQGGLDAYYNHSPEYYSNAFVNISSGKAFPFWQTGYSLFKNFRKGWEVEAGGRYIGFDTANIYTAVAAVSKYLNNTWINLRGFSTYDTKNWYPSFTLAARQYLNDRNDYLSFIGGSGRIPDDPGLLYNINNFRGYQSTTIGMGFQKTFRYKTILQGSFNYTNLRIPAKQSINQYDIYLSIFRNF